MDRDIITIDDYPELALLAWNRRERTIEGSEALALYEANWRFVDPSHMTDREQQLVDRLVREYGHGVLHV